CGVFSRYWGFHFVTNPNETLLVPRPVLNVALFFLYGASGKFLEDFAVGMLISSCYVLVQEGAGEHALRWIGEKLRRYSYWLLGAGALILLIMTAWNGYQRFQPHTAAVFDALILAYNQWSEFGLSWGYGLCMAALLFGPAILRKPLEWQPMRGIGLISYGMYMWHLPLLVQFTFKVQHHFMAGWNIYLTYGIYWLFVLLFIIPFCYLFYRFIERPGMRLGDRLLAKKETKGAPAASHASTHEQPRRVSGSLETAGARANR
ncbi:MAG: acyltransferase, partial [Ktedonobacteraceae bacterium]|nr:acyltransferase [Ktedonobacteraceae bacterium]